MASPVNPLPTTVTYRNERADATPAERIRVALVGGSGSVVTDDFYRLLLRRLRVVTTILLGIFLVTMSITLITGKEDDDGLPKTTEERINQYWPGIITLAITLPATIVLWGKPPRTIPGLRAVEWAVVGTLVVVLLAVGVSPYPYQPLLDATTESPRVASAFIGRYINAGSLLWFFVLTVYGTLIPNTLRRCALVCVSIALSPILLFAIVGFWWKPLPPGTVITVMIGLAVSNSVAVAIVLFASSRIEIMRKQASDARKLGQYVLKERLGSGGMGEVYRAEHALLRRPCALKTIRPERAGDPKNLRRFEREVQLTAALTHPNTVQIYDYGHAEDGTFYYVMEYLPGETLEELVKRDGPLPPARAVHFLHQICGALNEAHSRGLIHRDIKPGNVMVGERGGIPDVAKLLDFGLVLPAAGDIDDEKLTRDGALTGTPAYMSPEQAGGQDAVDPRSDIYSLGALAYFLVTGQPPFAGRSAMKMLAAHLYEQPVPLAQLRPDVPVELAAIIHRCLAKEPGGRFANVAELNAALAACQSKGVWPASEAAPSKPEPDHSLPEWAGPTRTVD